MATRNEKVNVIIGAKDNASRTINGIAKSIGTMAAAYLSIRTVTSFIKDSIGKALESERVYNDLAAAVERHVGSWNRYRGVMQAFTAEMQKTTGVSDELVAQGLQKMINAGLGVSDAMNAARTAMDLAAGDSSVGMQSAFDLVSKAAQGYTGTLSRYGIIIDQSLPQSKRFAAAVEQINQKFGGAAQAQMKTVTGQWNRLKEAIGDWQEALGKAAQNQEIRAIIAGFAAFFETIVKKFDEQIQVYGDWLRVLRVTMQTAVSQVSGAAKVIEAALSFDWRRLKVRMALFTIDSMMAFNKIAEHVRAAFRSTTRAVGNLFDAFHAGYMEWARVANESVVVVTEKTLTMMERIAQFSQRTGQLALQSIQLQRDEVVRFSDYQGGAYNYLKDTFVRAEEEKAAATQRFHEQALQMVGGFVSTMVDRMFEGKQHITQIFAGMALDFTKFFIKVALAAVMNRFIPGLGSLLGGMFDTPKYDRMAMTQGRHFAEYFQQGMMRSMQTFGAMVANSAGSAFGTFAPAMPVASGGMTINVYGMTDETYVRRNLVPLLEKVSRGNTSKVSLKRDNVTGFANGKFI